MTNTVEIVTRIINDLSPDKQFYLHLQENSSAHPNKSYIRDGLIIAIPNILINISEFSLPINEGIIELVKEVDPYLISESGEANFRKEINQIDPRLRQGIISIIPQSCYNNRSIFNNITGFAGSLERPWFEEKYIPLMETIGAPNLYKNIPHSDRNIAHSVIHIPMESYLKIISRIEQEEGTLTAHIFTGDFQIPSLPENSGYELVPVYDKYINIAKLVRDN